MASSQTLPYKHDRTQLHHGAFQDHQHLEWLSDCRRRNLAENHHHQQEEKALTFAFGVYLHFTQADWWHRHNKVKKAETQKARDSEHPPIIKIFYIRLEDKTHLVQLLRSGSLSLHSADAPRQIIYLPPWRA